MLERSRVQREQVLENELERIDAQLAKRERLYEEVRDDLLSRIKRYQQQLRQERNRGFGGSEPRREELKDQIDELSVDLRQERRDFWKDRQRLEQERRDVLRKLEELDADDIVEDLL